MKQFNLEEYLKNPEKRVVTRDGRAVRIICTDFNNKEYPIVVEIQGEMKPATLTEEGMFFPLDGNSDKDLFFAPEKHEGWVNLCRGNLDYIYTGCVYTSKDEAYEHKGDKEHCIATVKIEWEE